MVKRVLSSVVSPVVSPVVNPVVTSVVISVVRSLALSVVLTVFLPGWCVSSARAEKISIPSGSVLHCRLNQTITTQLNSQGDPFTATVSEPLLVDGHAVVRAGAKIEGRISQLQRPGRIRGAGELRLTANKVIMPDGSSLPLSAILTAVYGAEGVTVKGEEGAIHGPTARLKDLEEIGAGVGGGGLIGTMFGGLHGTIIGGAIGAAASFVDTLRKRGPDLNLPAGTQLNYHLTRELVIEPQLAAESSANATAEVEEKPAK